MSLDSWDETFRDLKRGFLAGARERLESVGRALDDLGQRPADIPALKEARSRFHGFAGAGGTYGFPEVSAAGNEGEAVCDRLLSERRPVSFDELAALQRTVTAIEKALDSPDRPAAPFATTPQRPAAFAGTAVILDEDASFREALAELLPREGLSVRAFRTAAEARAALAEHVPDVFVTSLALSDGSPGSLIEGLRERPGGERAVVAAVSTGAGFLDKVEAVTCGADFFVEKPVDLEAFVRRLRRALEPAATEAPRILSVEDDPDQAGFIRAVLESAGYEVRSLADPARFESETLSFGPDLILMDVNLPGAKGYDLVRFLRRDERFAALPVVFLTAEGQEQERIAGLRAGGDDHLVKPVAPGLLVSTVAARLERARFLKGLLIHDGLTGLLTHTAFFERAGAAAAVALRAPDRALALVLLDLDHFKAVNDTWGHPVGDRVLASLGLLLRRRLRASDAIGRLGGEEFALLLEGLSDEDALRLVQQLLDEFSKISHRSVDGTLFHVTFSGGIAFYEPPGRTLDETRQAADGALYAAKAAGRNRIELAPRIAGSGRGVAGTRRS